MWRVRFGGERWLPVVIYNGRSPWRAPTDVSALIASGGSALARYQPAQQYFLLDEGRVDGGSLPAGNLVSALIALETNRDRSRLPALLDTLIGLLQSQDDKELTDAFSAWAAQVLLPRRLRGASSAPLPRLEEVRTMLADTVQEWTRQWVEQGLERGLEQGLEQGLERGLEQGLERGLEQGRAEERALLCRQAARKFDAAAGQQLAAALADVTDPDRLAQFGDWIIECGTAAELFARLADTPRGSR